MEHASSNRRSVVCYMYVEHSTRSDALPEVLSKCSAREGLVLSGEKLVCMQVGRVRVMGFVGDNAMLLRCM